MEEFERSLAARIGMPEAVAVNSGTSGLHLALCALGIGQGDEVLLPSYVCSALLNAVNYVGATPVLVDSLQDHGHMNNAFLSLDPLGTYVVLTVICTLLLGCASKKRET